MITSQHSILMNRCEAFVDVPLCLQQVIASGALGQVTPHLCQSLIEIPLASEACQQAMTTQNELAVALDSSFAACLPTHANDGT